MFSANCVGINLGGGAALLLVSIIGLIDVL